MRTLAGPSLLALLATGCESELSVFGASGTAAEALAAEGWFVLLLGSAVVVVVVVLILIAVLRRRGSLDEHAPHDASGGKGWILIGGFAAPSLILGVVFVSTLTTMDAFPLGEQEAPVSIRVVGHQWWWEAFYDGEEGSQRFSTANEIHIPTGQVVDIALESADVIHSFWAPRLHGKVDLIPGRVNHIRIRAEEPGVYEGECAEFCGVQHAHMKFQVVAEPPEEYEAWLAHQRSSAAEPSTEAERRGRELFRARACAFCHTIRGASPGGSVAPDLTHIASRNRIAAGMLQNTRANLTAWVVDAPAIKPGTQMPAMPHFTGEELGDLIAYLQSLE